MNHLEYPPTATITIDGLAICFFNKSSLRWEVRFPREPRHKLTLKISENGKPRENPDISNAQQIRIYTVLGDYPDYGNEYKGGCLDLGKVKRKKDPDSKNMRWAINLCDEDDVTPGYRRLQDPPYGNTLLEITNAVFYVAEVSKTALYLVPVGVDPNKEPAKKQLFGRTSGLIAADISCQPDQGGVVIDIDHKVQIDLPAKSGTKYQIEFRNMEPKKAEDIDSRSERYFARLGTEREDDVLYKGDFDVYYDSLREARERYALWGPPVIIRSSRTDCDAVWMDNPDGFAS